MRVEEPQQVKTSTMLLPLTTNASVLEEIRKSFSTTQSRHGQPLNWRIEQEGIAARKMPLRNGTSGAHQCLGTLSPQRKCSAHLDFEQLVYG